ncbi:Deoxyribose-phosphate aldolase [Giardia muris]|uniref:deoxyribose-phosphate aldolase n=1 Tax=Giardia muris TaxID=5742 RepID=A0A4Z1T0I5_GIAMU|nr:Deoxyribose-phosphate aldolase [Giardia muris]|eukprot:TNJ30495.1 Deoxyribose-phosphate aldolase [Giardia muris]
MDSLVETIKERAALLSRQIGFEIPVCPVVEEPRQVPVNLAKYIDHTNLACDATPTDITRLCEEAKQHHFAAVCVNGCYARQIRQGLAGSGVKTCCVIGFPLGSMTVAAKIAETRELVQLGIEEIDMVINCGWLKAGMYREVYDDIKAIVDVCHYGSKPTALKVILECTCLETEELIIDASLLSLAAGADFIKTSTGMHKAGGARARDVKIMRLVAGKKMQVKAAGGIRDSTTAKEMILAGADRIGASASISICAP